MEIADAGRLWTRLPVAAMDAAVNQDLPSAYRPGKTDERTTMTDERGPAERLQDAATEHDPHGESATEQREDATSYSPSSERETEASQTLQRDDDDLSADGIDPSRVVAAPGTGGADDAGDVEPEPGDLNLPWQSESDREDTARS
ncbi:hypothetical protein ASF23_06800 [Curtobacterium sp. Leaf261]|nr:hypothetical protein ASF23_06800 [Curtobacterium sp. Leaf261]